MNKTKASKWKMRVLTKILSCLFLGLYLTGCVGAVVGAAVDTTIEVAKVPFKVAGAAVEVIVPDSDDDKN